MSTPTSRALPTFTAAPVPELQLGQRTIGDHNGAPRCAACGGWGPVDEKAGVCVACWRVVVLLPAVLRAGEPSGIIGRHWVQPAAASPAEEKRCGAEPDKDLCRSCGDRRTWDGCGALLAPPDELAHARERREVPRLTDDAGPGGVAVHVALEPPPLRKPPR